MGKKPLLPVIMLSVGLIYLALSACAAAPARTNQTPPPASAEAPHWTYGGDTGPEYWYSLDPAYTIARDGKAQSPVDIVSPELTLKGALGKPVFKYRKTHFDVENNGHTIELVPLSGGNSITLDDESYELRQFHFHAPGEHLIDGGSFAMELHLLHTSARENTAVVGMMITPGAYNETLGGIFENLPGEITGEGKAGPEVEINLADLLTGQEGMYRYDGSLTTPPCSEGVKWSIFARPLEMSNQQIRAFEALYRGNNRPVQNRYGRHIYLVEEVLSKLQF
jgi:carbonic anhydrase